MDYNSGKNFRISCPPLKQELIEDGSYLANHMEYGQYWNEKLSEISEDDEVAIFKLTRLRLTAFMINYFVNIDEAFQGLIKTPDEIGAFTKGIVFYIIRDNRINYNPFALRLTVPNLEPEKDSFAKEIANRLIEEYVYQDRYFNSTRLNEIVSYLLKFY
ncbi:hypothetical protein GF376_00920 [Candidatus Peregrinibacteria bacterium]|nr:hypothetical protein [Candidatus Peregrinibacteria bacterium]